MNDPSLADWLQAAGGIGSAVTAIVLAILAYGQMRANRKMAKAADEQVTLMRADAVEDRRHRDQEDARRATELSDRDAAVRDQISALASITDATRDAAHAQLQPIVFTHERERLSLARTTTLTSAKGKWRSPTT